MSVRKTTKGIQVLLVEQTISVGVVVSGLSETGSKQKAIRKQCTLPPPPSSSCLVEFPIGGTYQGAAD